jgi:hypothetical protein
VTDEQMLLLDNNDVMMDVILKVAHTLNPDFLMKKINRAK